MQKVYKLNSFGVIRPLRNANVNICEINLLCLATFPHSIALRMNETISQQIKVPPIPLQALRNRRIIPLFQDHFKIKFLLPNLYYFPITSAMQFIITSHDYFPRPFLLPWEGRQYCAIVYGQGVSLFRH